MIDLHSHVLPELDDGSCSASESEKMLRMSYAQGVDIMVASPHFYPEQKTAVQFLEDRRRAREKLQWDAACMPKLLLGAEVAYYDGMSRSEHVRELCIEGSKLLLVEMPCSPWTTRMLEDMTELPKRQGVVPVLAHIERYFKLLPDRHTLDDLQAAGVCFQCNASFFLMGFRSRRAMRMLKDGKVQFLGSDCHGAEFRAPNLETAVKIICKKGGGSILSELDMLGRQLLCL